MDPEMNRESAELFEDRGGDVFTLLCTVCLGMCLAMFGLCENLSDLGLLQRREL